MARSDLIIDLVKAGVSGNQDSVRVTAEAIAADERAKKHTGVADRINDEVDIAAQSLKAIVLAERAKGHRHANGQPITIEI